MYMYMYIDATGRNLMKHLSKHAALQGCANKGLDNTSLENTVSDGFIDWNLLIFYQPLSSISCDRAPDFTVVFLYDTVVIPLMATHQP